MRFFPALHALRGFAAVWVVLFHIWIYSGEKKSLLSGFYSMGFSGVHLFYVLSAFLLGYIYFEKSEASSWNVKSFYKRRFLRIFPAYYAQFLVIMCLALMGYYAVPSWYDFLAHLFLFLNLPPINTQPLNGVWWTLPIEFMFYLIMPFLVILLKRLEVLIFGSIVLCITILYRFYIYDLLGEQPIPVISAAIGQLPGVLSIFSFGLIFAYIVTSKKNKIYRNYVLYIANIGWFFVLIAMILWALVLIWADNYWQQDLLFYWESVNGFLIALFVVSVYRSNNILFINKFTIWLGKISYGIYLWHLPLIVLFEKQVNSFYSLSVIVIPLTILLASISFYQIERRFFKFGH